MNPLSILSLVNLLPTIEQIVATAPTQGSATQRLQALGGTVLPLLEQIGAAFFPQLAPTLHLLAGGTTVSRTVVMGIQEALNLLVTPSQNLRVDGLLGPHTKNAIMALQKAHGLPSTGFVADAEWAIIQTLLAKIK